jgi:plasmid stabilization system protein ParE
MNVRFSRRALAQLRAILEGLAAENPRAAVGFAKRIQAILALLTGMQQQAGQHGWRGFEFSGLLPIHIFSSTTLTLMRIN